MSKNEQFHKLVTKLLAAYKVVRHRVDTIDLIDGIYEKADHLVELNNDLTNIKKLEIQISPIRDEMKSNGESLETETRKIVDETIEIVSALVPRLGLLEELARNERENLSPQIHQGVRAMQMQAAYTRHQ